MPVSERAKIFIPFEPLRGFRQALRERERAQLVQPRADLTENQMEELSREMAALAPGDMARVTHYVDDHYEETVGCVTKVSASDSLLHLVGRPLRFDAIRELERL